MTATIAAHDARPFAWGRADCFALAMDVACAITGRADPFAAERRRYRTEKGAARALHRLGAATAPDLLARAFPEIPPAMARVGDLASVRGPDGLAVCGVVIGADLLVRGPGGLARVPRERAERAFRVE